MEHAALPAKDSIMKLKEGKGPVLWPGMDGLRLKDGNEPATVTMHDDSSTEKKHFPPDPPVPPTPPIKKEN